ncbi:hypothetical protein M231_06240 [Tremella mesenterica]|uniref:Uncharacterized protein n=1 Tax=Tremella mesenterica TaxID=5217 RepID=A0A4Q1BCF4_TREME|nr:hypothetical protein M231_06240 [Tremella mesenterica]
MDSLGLPISFGKQSSLPSKPPHPSGPAVARRGDSSSRGPRGAVGVGRQNRGRGRGSEFHDAQRRDTGWPSNAEHLNGNFKRPHPSSDSPGRMPSGLPIRPENQLHSGGRGQGPVRGRGRGGNGPRGGRGGQSGSRGGPDHQAGGNSHQGEEQGYFKESMCEDPWKELLEERARRRERQAS